MKKTKFEPMLAARELPEKIKYPIYASIKLDGYRATVRNGTALTRKLKPIVNPFVQKYLGRVHFNGLDGELTIGPPNAPDLINRMGEIRRLSGEPDFTFRVFDDWTLSRGFSERYKSLRMSVSKIGDLRIVVIEHKLLRNDDELHSYEEMALSQGYEGLILRDPNGPYKFGRSTENEGWMIKVKRWKDDEMRITGFEEEMENTNEAETNELGRTKRSKKKAGLVGKGRLGAFIGVDLKTGVEVRIGGGFTAKQREDFWRERRRLLDEIVTYKHFEQTGVMDKRRFTIFRAFRDPDDL